MPATTYMRQRIVDSTLRNVAYVPAVAVFVSLHTSDPTIAGDPATEINSAVATWYARQTCTFAAQVTAGVTSNSGVITFAAVTGGTSVVTHFAIWDLLTGNNCLYFAPLSATKTFNVSDVPSWLAGTLTMTCT